MMASLYWNYLLTFILPVNGNLSLYVSTVYIWTYSFIQVSISKSTCKVKFVEKINTAVDKIAFQAC